MTQRLLDRDRLGARGNCGVAGHATQHHVDRDECGMLAIRGAADPASQALSDRTRASRSEHGEWKVGPTRPCRPDRDLCHARSEPAGRRGGGPRHCAPYR